MIGLGIGPCVLDIVFGRFTLEQVDRIVTATQCRHRDAWFWTVQGCRLLYWQKCASEAERVFRILLSEGKIVQPGLDPKTPRIPVILNKIYWVESEDQITWKSVREG
jgi:hypothetical protein